MKQKLIIPKLVWSLFLSLCLCPLLPASIIGAPFEVTDHNIVTKRRLELTKFYARRHYGKDTYNLIRPKIITIHYTAMASLGRTLGTLEPDIIPRHRDKIAPFGRVNVGVHFVIDGNGDIYSLMPTTIMGRHVSGFNHTSIGIENVASSSLALTKEQIISNSNLIAFLIAKHPSIDYLIGHHEYMHQKLPHYKEFIQKDLTFTPLIKVDPGFDFMNRLRAVLYNRHQIKLKD